MPVQFAPVENDPNVDPRTLTATDAMNTDPRWRKKLAAALRSYGEAQKPGAMGGITAPMGSLQGGVQGLAKLFEIYNQKKLAKQAGQVTPINTAVGPPEM